MPRSAIRSGPFSSREKFGGTTSAHLHGQLSGSHTVRGPTKPRFLVSDGVRTSARGVTSHSRPERYSAKRPHLTSTASSPESFKLHRTRAVGTISLNVLDNPHSPRLLGGESWTDKRQDRFGRRRSVVGRTVRPDLIIMTLSTPIEC